MPDIAKFELHHILLNEYNHYENSYYMNQDISNKLREISAEYWPTVTKRDHPNDSAFAMVQMLLKMSSFYEGSVPREWFKTFEGLHDQGVIGKPAWSVAAKLAYAGGKSLTKDTKYGMSKLAGMRKTDPLFFMDAYEYRIWRSLGKSVVLYRGTCTDKFDATWHGLSWTNSPDLATDYALHRTYQLYDKGERSGWPRLIEARIPSSAVIGVAAHEGMDDVELIVDFERIAPANVRELNPVARTDLDAYKAQLAHDIDGTLELRQKVEAIM